MQLRRRGSYSQELVSQAARSICLKQSHPKLQLGTRSRRPPTLCVMVSSPSNKAHINEGNLAHSPTHTQGLGGTMCLAERALQQLHPHAFRQQRLCAHRLADEGHHVPRLPYTALPGREIVLHLGQTQGLTACEGDSPLTTGH